MNKIIDVFGIKYFPRDAEIIAKEHNLLIKNGWKRCEPQPPKTVIPHGILYAKHNNETYTFYELPTHSMETKKEFTEKMMFSQESFDENGFFKKSTKNPLPF